MLEAELDMAYHHHPVYHHHQRDHPRYERHQIFNIYTLNIGIIVSYETVSYNLLFQPFKYTLNILDHIKSTYLLMVATNAR